MSLTAVRSGPVAKPEFEQIAALVQDFMLAKAWEEGQRPFVAGKTAIPLNVPTYGSAEVVEALESLLSGWVTMGRKVKQFEATFAEYIGTKHGVMANSGSSANLLALSLLGLERGVEVITPALTWATTVFPIAQVGAVPVLVDVDRETYNLNIGAVERAINSRTVAIMPVHLLGNPCDVGGLVELAQYYDLTVIEDCCEAHGAEWNGKKVGSFGDLATFSFFFSHHISTIEGGMLLANTPLWADRARSLRAHGWIRDMSNKAEIAVEYPGIDSRFLFYHAGYNFRPTEIQGAFGIHQLPLLEPLIQHRRQNADYWNEELAEFEEFLVLPEERRNTRHVWFAYPVMVREGAPFKKRALVEHLEARGLETRPIEAGAMHLQPAMGRLQWRAGGPLTNAEYIHDNAFFFGNHQAIGDREREAIVGYFHEFFEGL